MSDTLAPPLAGYISRVRFLNELYANRQSPPMPEEVRAEMVKEIITVFDAMRLDARAAYEAHIVPGSRRLSIRHGQRTAPLEFGPDYAVIENDPLRPVGYRGSGLKRGPTVDGSRVYCTIGGQNVSGYITAHAKLTPAAVERMVETRVVEFRTRLQELILEDDIL